MISNGEGVSKDAGNYEQVQVSSTTRCGRYTQQIDEMRQCGGGI